MNKLFISLLFCFLPLVVSSEQSKIDPLKIGVITPLTGGVAVWGKSVMTAIQIANKESTSPAELFFQDEETCVPAKAVSAYRYLITVKKVDVIVASCLGGAKAIAPMAKKDNIPFFISGRSSQEYQAKNPNALSWLSLLDYEGKAIANLVEKQQWKKGIALVWSEYFGVQFAAAIKNAVNSEAFDYSVLELPQSTVLSPTEVQSMFRQNPDVIFLMLSEPDAAFVVKQLKALGYQGDIVIQSSMLQTYDPKVRANFVGVIQQKFVVRQDQFMELQQRVKKILKIDVADDFVFSYDGFTALLTAIKVCRENQTQSLNNCLMEDMRDEVWREGVSGKFRFMKDGSTERPMVFKRITKTGLEDL